MAPSTLSGSVTLARIARRKCCGFHVFSSHCSKLTKKYTMSFRCSVLSVLFRHFCQPGVSHEVCSKKLVGAKGIATRSKDASY